MNHSHSNYEQYQVWKSELSAILQDDLVYFSQLNMQNEVLATQEAINKLESDTFKVMVIGNFNTGKSTFINALLGEDVLPTSILPCTAVINELKYGTERKAILHFKKEMPAILPDKLSSKALEHIKQYAGQEIPPVEIAITELQDYVVIPNPENVEENAKIETPFDKVELFWDLKLCEKGVEIIDSPGLEDDDSRTKIVLDYFNQIDAVLFVMSSVQLCTQKEMAFIDNTLRKAGHEYLFFVCNRADQVPARERERLINFGKAKLKGKTQLEDSVHFISAYQALNAKLENNMEQYEQSGVSNLDLQLSRFLTRDRGKVKLLRPSKECSSFSKKALTEVIPFQKRLLETDLMTLEKQYAQIHPRLAKLEKDKEKIAARISERQAALYPNIVREVEHHLDDLISNIPQWAADITVENEISVFNPKESSQQVVREVLEKLQGKIEEEQTNWVENSFSAYISSQIKDMMSEFEKDFTNFFIELEKVKMSITGTNPDDVILQDKTIEERVGAGLVGLLFGDIGSAIYGGANGFDKSLVKQIAVQIGLVVGMLLLGVTNPIVWFGAILTGGIGQLLWKGNTLTKQVKEKVGIKVAEEMKKNKTSQAESVANRVVEQLLSYTEPIKRNLENEISSLRKQVEEALKNKKEGETKVKAKLAELSAISQNIQRLDDNLTNFTFTVAGLNTNEKI